MAPETGASKNASRWERWVGLERGRSTTHGRGKPGWDLREGGQECVEVGRLGGTGVGVRVSCARPSSSAPLPESPVDEDCRLSSGRPGPTPWLPPSSTPRQSPSPLDRARRFAPSLELQRLADSFRLPASCKSPREACSHACPHNIITGFNIQHEKAGGRLRTDHPGLQLNMFLKPNASACCKSEGGFERGKEDKSWDALSSVTSGTREAYQRRLAALHEKEDSMVYT